MFTQVVIFEVLSGFETAVAALLWTLIWFVVSFMDFHMKLTFVLRFQLQETISALCIVTDVKHTQRCVPQAHFRYQQVIQIEGVLVFVERLIQETIETGKVVVIVLILVWVLVNIGEDLQASLLEAEGNSKLFVAVFADPL